MQLKLTHRYKVSLRARNDVDVSRMAMRFGGGGHRRAAGFNMNASPEEILRILEELVKEELP